MMSAGAAAAASLAGSHRLGAGSSGGSSSRLRGGTNAKNLSSSVVMHRQRRRDGGGGLVVYAAKGRNARLAGRDRKATQREDKKMLDGRESAAEDREERASVIGAKKEKREPGVGAAHSLSLFLSLSRSLSAPSSPPQEEEEEEAEEEEEDPKLASAWFQPLNLSSDLLVSQFGFTCNVRRYAGVKYNKRGVVSSQPGGQVSKAALKRIREATTAAKEVDGRAGCVSL